MTAFGTIFWLFVFACLGAIFGGLIERGLHRRSKPTAPPIPSENNLAKVGDFEILRAWRTAANKVWLEIDGIRLESKDALSPDQRQRLLSLVVDLRPWLDGGRTASAPATLPSPVPGVLPAASEKKKDKPAEETKPVVVLKSIVEQIDEVLQAKLETSPFKDRKIALLEGPGGTVVVQDGSSKYEGIDTIPDPQIKALIQSAVAEWEKGSH
jgi:hypothetical protein